MIAQPLWWPSLSERWLHSSLPCFLAPRMSPPPSRETGSPRGAVTSEKVVQVCQHLAQSKVLKFSVIGWLWQNTQNSHSPSQTSCEPYKGMLNPPRPLTTGAIKCKQLPFDSPDETLVYEDDLQLGKNFVSDGHFLTVFVLQRQKE